ncbi:ribonucleotide reductase subunit alpha [Gordonibacter sp. Marseille-P4307]|uniref:ribonucleotide reductase subunit alpha n=1 Tax=Gordonibacter sp. Marseille-P4307 TaxID=2161815 RepID=UPI000F521205|nr:ribonucleotide reductase subunit alpha [Gordonibacter sp. Marseille-P4307]
MPDNHDGAENVPFDRERVPAASDYLANAAAAGADGQRVLSMHLYLTAFEEAAKSGLPVGEAAVAGLHAAWDIACDLKERSLAEYIFERLEPYLSADEMQGCADRLQGLALDKLEEFGLSREELEDMAEMISQDYLGGTLPFMQFEKIDLSASLFGEKGVPASDSDGSAASGRPVDRTAADAESALARADASDDGSASSVAEVLEASEANRASSGVENPADRVSRALSGQAGGPSDSAASSDKGVDSQRPEGILGIPGMPAGEQMRIMEETVTYADLSGYHGAVAAMRQFGIGVKNDRRYLDLIEMLNLRHGVDRVPVADTLLFRSPAREDANRFMMATLGELNLPMIRMVMEENFQGLPVLCVMTQSGRRPRVNMQRAGFEGPGVLVLEDIDLWNVPDLDSDPADVPAGLSAANVSRAVRETLNFVRCAVDNPDVYVLATASTAEEIDPFFYDLLDPVSVIDIDYPTQAERTEIWIEIAAQHPSMRGIDCAALVRYSEGMPRFDMYMAAREAIEDAYKQSLNSAEYTPVTGQNIFEKMAAYQPLDSKEYRALETEVLRDFRRDLEHLDDLLKGRE